MSTTRADHMLVGFAGVSAVITVSRSGFTVLASPFQLGAISLAGIAAALLVVRRCAHDDGGSIGIYVVMPSIVLSSILVALSPDVLIWTRWQGMVFATAALWTCWALGTLGRSFGIAPANRGLVTHGLYSLIRHPAYLGEYVMVTASIASIDQHSILLIAIASDLALLLAVMIRIEAEEVTLANDPGWSEYADRVRYRTIPWIW